MHNVWRVLQDATAGTLIFWTHFSKESCREEEVKDGVGDGLVRLLNALIHRFLIPVVGPPPDELFRCCPMIPFSLIMSRSFITYRSSWFVTAAGDCVHHRDHRVKKRRIRLGR